MNDMQPLKVLVVDDEATARQTIKYMLQELGYEVFEAADGLEAIDLFTNAEPNLVLLDIVIPHIDGFDVLRKIRERDELCAVIMISALSSEQLAVKCMQNGADDYACKPIMPRNLQMNINRAVDRMEQRQAEAERISQLEVEVAELRQKLAGH